MTTDALSQLVALEAIIERGLETFVEVGEALRKIRDRRLYRDHHATFEDYCRERWGMSRRHANRTIEATDVAGVLGPMGPIPQTERQARELAPLKAAPEKMAAAWREASADGAPTAEKVREAVGRRMDVHYSSKADDWATPQDLFGELDAEFGFTLDVCALDSSAKCAEYFTPADNGLRQDWGARTCWMNPPYGEAIRAWVEKAHCEAAAGATVVCLVPARVDTGWWWDFCRWGEIRFLRGRLKFGDAHTSAPFPSAVVVFGPRADRQAVKWWDR